MEYKSLFKPPLTRAMKAGLVSLNPGESVGEHKTEKREEAIVVLRGTATITVEGQETEALQGQVHYIGPEKAHDVKNNGSQGLEYVYVVCLL